MSSVWARRLPLALVACALALLAGGAAQAGAQGLADDDGAEWRVEQPASPPPPPGVESYSHTPIGLGRIGDIEFWAPNRGALITAGNGSTVPPGVWFYNGQQWRELATVCGASDGRIAWAGENEFWTISNGRPGQAVASVSEIPPLEDNTLCHFAPPPGEPNGSLEVVASYASPAFLSTSYQAMHAAACLTDEDCWFAGEPLEAPQVGSFQLHWNGHALEAAPYLPEGHAVEDMREFEEKLYESVRLLQECAGEVTSDCDRIETLSRHPAALHIINGEGAPRVFEKVEELPLYDEETGHEEFYPALDYLHLSADENSLWGAAGPQLEPPKNVGEAGVTVIRKAGSSPSWTQALGPATTPTGLEAFPNDVVDGIAAEPQTESAWIALESTTDAVRAEPSASEPARVARISANGTLSDELQLPASGEPYGPKGAADELACPAVHDCWLTSTHGWLLHLSTTPEYEEEHEEEHGVPDGRPDPHLLVDPVFAGEEPIAFRPPDEGLPAVPPDAPPVDDSGLEEFKPVQEDIKSAAPTETFATVTVPLLSDMRSRLVRGTTLELSFHLAVKARVRLLAKRHTQVIASTPTQTLRAGAHSLSLRLDRHRWPTKLDLQTHALAPLPTRSTREAGTNTVSTSLAFPNARGGLPNALGGLVPLLPALGSGHLF